jgi:16S rRNA (guanine527-N7)-methyltransferase
MQAVLELLAADPRSLTAVRDPVEGWRAHVDDSLTGLLVPELAEAARIADVGSGAGFPGLALALARPHAHVDLIESVARKADFIRAAAEHAGIQNAIAIATRSEDHAAAPPPDGGRESYDAVTARAVGRLSTLAELASPLLHEGGVLVAWKGRRDAEEEAELERAASATAMEAVRVLDVGERAGYEHRHLHVVRKSGSTPANLPRRAGIARKRPYGAQR